MHNPTQFVHTVISEHRTIKTAQLGHKYAVDNKLDPIGNIIKGNIELL